MSWWATSSISPSSLEAASIMASSSAEAVVPSSSRGYTPKRRTMPFPTALRNASTGRTTHT